MNGRVSKMLRRRFYPKQIRDAVREGNEKQRRKAFADYEKEHGRPPAPTMQLTFRGQAKTNDYRKSYRIAKRLYSMKDAKFMASLPKLKGAN